MASSNDIPEGLTHVKSVGEMKKKEQDFVNDAVKHLALVADRLVKNDETATEQLSVLGEEFKKAQNKYEEESAAIRLLVQSMRKAGATEAEILAYIKNNVGITMKGTQDMQDALLDVKRKIADMVESSESISGIDRLIMRKQLDALENSARFQKTYADMQTELMEGLQNSLEDLYTESKAQRRQDELRDRLEEYRRLEDKKLEKARAEEDKRLQARREREDRNADIKGSLVTAMLGPLRLFTDPILKVVTKDVENTEQFFKSRFAKNLESKREIEDEQIAGRREREDKELGYIKDFESKRNELYLSTQAQLDALAGGEAALLPVFGQKLPGQEVPYDNQDAFIEQIVDAEYSPLLEKTAPNQNTLLAKGGILGASAVYLGNLLGDRLDEISEDQDKKTGEGGLPSKASEFLSKNGLSLMKLAAPLAAMAVGGFMVKKGLDMQKRDTEDAKKYFEEGNTARGIETAWLGDRARLTEENANSELGRTTGKTTLLAGGAATVGVGAMGAIAAGGALTGGAGLAGAGAAGMAAMGAAFPPALIAAAVAVGATVIAKGTQEAFELGWDKNQANIQKELNAVIFSEDASLWDKIKAGLESTWKGVTGSLAGGIREAGSILDAEAQIQNQKQIDFLKSQADAGNESYARLLSMLQDEQFQAMDENEQKMLMQAEGLYDDYQKMQQETQKTFGEHLLTAGRVIGGFFTGMADTAKEGIRAAETARWETETLKGMDTMSAQDVERLKQSAKYQETIANSGNAKSAMEAAYLNEQKDIAMARGDLTKDGMVMQTGGLFGKYLGMGDMGLAYKERKTGTDALDNEYRQTFEYSKRKAELMNEGKTAEEADLAVIAEQNQLYEDALTLRLKQSDDYKNTFDKVLKETKDIKKAEEAGLKAARQNKKNTMTTTALMKKKFGEVWTSVKDFSKNIGGWFKDKFSAAGEEMERLGKIISDGASAVWNSVTEWASGLWSSIGEKFTKVLGALKDVGSGALDLGKAGLEWLGDKAADVRDWATGEKSTPDASIDDGIVLKNGKVIELSQDDNVYATKNEPKVIRDREAQAAMPNIPKTPVDFSDKNIVMMLQMILDRLNKMDIQPQVITSGGDINFDGLKMAGAL